MRANAPLRWVKHAVTSAHDWIFGIQLPIQTLARTLVDPWEDTATVDDLVAITEAADRAGFGICRGL